MPLRFPPECPEPPLRGATRAQIQRYQSAYQAWCVGSALREYAQTLHSLSRHELPDELAILSSPHYDTLGSPVRRLAENGTPVSMDEICTWIDKQARTVAPVARCYTRLRQDLPRVAYVVWVRHVDLWTIEEIAARQRVSERTVLRYLGIAHLRLMAAMERSAGEHPRARRLVQRAELAEATMHRTGDFSGKPAPDELAESGVVVVEKPKMRRRRVRAA